jgi:hypothetical protein
MRRKVDGDSEKILCTVYGSDGDMHLVFVAYYDRT